MAVVESNKAKIAKRVIEVLEFFDEQHPEATVMDIVRRFNRPQSSTSELLSSMVDLGLLYKNHCARSYAPTPRAAMLGSAVQPGMIRDGRLTAMIDRLSAQTGLGIAVFGMVGTKTQIFCWRPGSRILRTARPSGFGGGMQEHLTETAAGWLLLSALPQSRHDGLLRRLNAEAPDDRKFSVPEMTSRTKECRELGYASGMAGFGSIADVVAMLLPIKHDGQPLAIGFVFEPSEQIDRPALQQSLADAIAWSAEQGRPQSAPVQPLFNAA